MNRSFTKWLLLLLALMLQPVEAVTHHYQFRGTVESYGGRRVLEGIIQPGDQFNGYLYYDDESRYPMENLFYFELTIRNYRFDGGSDGRNNISSDRLDRISWGGSNLPIVTYYTGWTFESGWFDVDLNNLQGSLRLFGEGTSVEMPLSYYSIRSSIQLFPLPESGSSLLLLLLGLGGIACLCVNAKTPSARAKGV